MHNRRRVVHLHRSVPTGPLSEGYARRGFDPIDVAELVLHRAVQVEADLGKGQVGRGISAG